MKIPNLLEMLAMPPQKTVNLIAYEYRWEI